MQVKIIQVVPEKPYIRGGIQHTRERPYLLVAGQDLPPAVLDEVQAQYPGTDRKPVKAAMLAEFNRKPTLVMATVMTVEIEVRDEGGGMRDEGPISPLAKQSYAELQQLCHEADLPANGKKEDLIARLTEAGIVPTGKS